MNKKVCTKCKIEKELTEFHKKKDSKDGLRGECKECVKEYREKNKKRITKQRKEYYETNKERILKQNKEYQEGNKDKIKERKEKYYKTNREKILEQKKEYQKANKEKIREVKRTYRENNKEKLKEQRKVYYNANKEKIKEHKKEYYEANKEKMNKKSREYRQNNKEKLKENRRKYLQTGKGKINRIRANHIRRARIAQAKNLGTYTIQELEECRKFFNYCCAYSGKPLKGNEEIEHIIPISKGGTNNINNIVLATKEVNRSKYNSLIDEWYPKQSYYSKERHEKIKEWIKIKSQVNLFEI